MFSALICVVFFGGVEGALWLAGARTRMQDEDPFRGFSALVPVFAREGDTYRTRSTGRQQVFNRQSFRAAKSSNGLRIFGLGGSSAYGYPWGADAAFLSILGDAIAAAHPGREVEAVNAAGMSYAMHRLRIVANEIMDYEPDILVIYSGHNEFIERAFYGALKQRSPHWNQLEATLSKSRLYSLMYRLLREPSASGRSLTEQFDAAVRRDSTVTFTSREKQEIVTEFRANLRHIVQQAQQRGVKVLLATVPANLRDWRPEASIVETDLDEAQSMASTGALARGRKALEAGRYIEAAEALRKALALIPSHAEATYLLAQADDGLRNWDEARAEFQQAADLDASPIRRLSTLNEAVREVAREEGALLVDMDLLFEQESEHGLVGLNLIEDYVHPTRDAHQLIAWHMWRAIEQAGWISGVVTVTRTAFDGMLARRPVPTVDQTQTPVWLTNQARLLANQDKTAQAIDKLREAVRLRPDYRLARYNLGVLLSRSGLPEEGEQQLRQVVRIDPADYQGWNALGTTLLRLKRRDEAIQAFRRALDIKPDFDLAWNNLGAAQEELGHSADAIDTFRRALKINPNHAGFRTNLGNVLLEVGRIEEALVELRAAAQSAPDSFAAQDGLAHALIEAKDYAGAEQRLRLAIRLSPDSVPSHTRLGVVLLAQGKVEPAVESLRQALSIAPDDPEARRQLETALARKRD